MGLPPSDDPNGIRFQRGQNVDRGEAQGKT